MKGTIIYSFVILKYMHEIYRYRCSTSVLNEYYRKFHVFMFFSLINSANRKHLERCTEGTFISHFLGVQFTKKKPSRQAFMFF